MHAQLREHLKPVQYERGGCILPQGEVCADVFFMHSGLVKLHYVTFEGKERIKSFIADHGVFGSRTCQTLNLGSPFSITAIENIIGYRISYNLFERVSLTDNELLRLIFAFNQAVALRKELREYELLCLPAEERYLRFCIANESLLPRLSQVEISQYLGMTPVSLSRIKRRSQVNAP